MGINAVSGAVDDLQRITRQWDVPVWRSSSSSQATPEFWDEIGLGTLQVSGVEQVRKRIPVLELPYFRSRNVQYQHTLSAHLPTTYSGQSRGVVSHGFFQVPEDADLVTYAEKISLATRKEHKLSFFPLVAALTDAENGRWLTVPVWKNRNGTHTLPLRWPAGIDAQFTRTNTAVDALYAPSLVLDLSELGDMFNSVPLGKVDYPS